MTETKETKKYQIVEAPYKPQKKGMTLSNSSVAVMEKCPREYFWQYIMRKRVPDEQPWNAFGNMIHLIADNYKGGGQEEIKELFKCFQEDEKLKKKYIDKLDDKYRKKVVIALKNLYKWLSKRMPIAVDYKSEMQIDIYDYAEVNEIPIHLQGKLDGNYFLDDNIFVTDFKTGKKKKDHSTQLGFYLFLLGLKDKGVLDIKVIGEIVNLSLDENPDYEEINEYYDLEEYDYIRSENRVNKAIENMRERGISKEDKENWKKKPQVLCGWCKFKKSGDCNGRCD